MKKLLVVDGNSIVNRAFYGIRHLSNREGFPTNALYGTVNILSRVADSLHPDFAAVAFDRKEPTFRHKMYDLYKAGRKPMPEELCVQMPAAKELVGAMGFTTVELAGYEADDILGTLSAMAEREEDCVAYLLTGDRDALQLISDRVHVLLATNAETIDFDKTRFFEKYGVGADCFVDVKALMGDSSDHIPGVPGIGEKTALSLIATYGSLDGVYEALPEAKLTPSVRSKLENGRDSAYLSKDLARICREVPLGTTLADYAFHGPRKAELRRLFLNYQFHSFLKKMEENEKKAPEKKTEDTLSSFSEEELMGGQSPIAVCILENEVYLSDGTNTGKYSGKIEALTKTDRPIICHDAKSVYKAISAMGASFRNCAFDTMLGAYVLNPAESDYSFPAIALLYLGENPPVPPYHLSALLALYHAEKAKIEEENCEELLYGIEMPLAAVLCDMELAGFCVNKAGLIRYGEELSHTATELANRIYTYAGGEFNINSTKQLGEVLFEKLGLPHGKKTKTGYSTNAEVLEKLLPYHPVIEDILDYRQLTKLNSTYAEGLLREIGPDGRIHTVFKQTGTATGRLSSAEPNLQNIPIRTELGKELRRYFTAQNDNYLLIDADYSQIELRLLAALSKDTTMCSAFEADEDIHAATASGVFGVPPEAVTPELRKKAKAVNFGILYGMGAHSLSEDLHISMAKAKEYIENYFATYPGIDGYLKAVIKDAYRDGYVSTLFGRRRYIPELKMANKNLQHFGERVAMNSPIQGTAADIIKIAMIHVDRKLKEEKLAARLILQVHDELIIECEKSVAPRAREILCREMENAVSLAVKLKVSAGEGENWYDAH